MITNSSQRVWGIGVANLLAILLFIPVAAAQGNLPTAIIQVESAHVRTGPGIEYPVIGAATLDQVCTVIGRSAIVGWWQLECNNGVTGWVAEQLYTIQGETSGVPLVAVDPPPAPAQPSAPAGFPQWKTSYFSNRDLAGTAVAIENVPEINFNWGSGTPHANLPPDNFSVRFERTLNFAADNYRFSVIDDDGVRVFLDGELILDDWQDGSARELHVDRQLSGNHNLVVEYFEGYGDATIRFTYAPIQAQAPPPAQVGLNEWLASYYGNTGLGEPPLVARVEGRHEQWPLNYEWSLGSPVPGVVPENNWSARWKGRFHFESGDYRFLARGNLGVRVYVNGKRVIDAWPNSEDTVSNVFHGLGSGDHEITVEHYKQGGLAWVRAWWQKENDGGHRDE